MLAIVLDDCSGCDSRREGTACDVRCALWGMGGTGHAWTDLGYPNLRSRRKVDDHIRCARAKLSLFRRDRAM